MRNSLLAVLCLAIFLSGCGSDTLREKSATQLLTEANAEKNPASRTTKLCSAARKLHDAKDVIGLRQALSAAVASSQQVEDPQMRAGVQIKTAAALAKFGQQQEASDMLTRAREAARKVADPVIKVQILSDAAWALGDVEGSAGTITAYCQEALLIADGITEPAAQVQSYAAIVRPASKASSPDLADEVLAKARAAAELAETPARASLAQAQIGAALVKIERADDATQAFQLARTKADAIEDADTRAYALVKLGEILITAKRKPEAEQVLAAAEASAQNIKSASDQAAVMEVVNKVRGRL